MPIAATYFLIIALHIATDVDGWSSMFLSTQLGSVLALIAKRSWIPHAQDGANQI
jgi:hypothetical protein